MSKHLIKANIDMNKKTYVTPHAEVVNIITEGMIAESLRIGDTEGSVQLTNKKDWDSSDWSTPEESFWGE